MYWQIRSIRIDNRLLIRTLAVPYGCDKRWIETGILLVVPIMAIPGMVSNNSTSGRPNWPNSCRLWLMASKAAMASANKLSRQMRRFCIPFVFLDKPNNFVVVHVHDLDVSFCMPGLLTNPEGLTKSPPQRQQPSERMKIGGPKRTRHGLRIHTRHSQHQQGSRHVNAALVNIHYSTRYATMATGPWG
jgi:hypothetical protein